MPGNEMSLVPPKERLEIGIIGGPFDRILESLADLLIELKPFWRNLSRDRKILYVPWKILVSLPAGLQRFRRGR